MLLNVNQMLLRLKKLVLSWHTTIYREQEWSITAQISVASIIEREPLGGLSFFVSFIIKCNLTRIDFDFWLAKANNGHCITLVSSLLELSIRKRLNLTSLNLLDFVLLTNRGLCQYK